MSGQEIDPRRQARILTEEDLIAIKRMIAAVTGAGEGKNPAILLHDLTFKEAVGGIAAGTTFPLGTPHDDIFKRMAKSPVTFPTYKSPGLTLSAAIPTDPEIGSLLSLKFTPTWTRNDAGNPTGYVLKKSGLNMFSHETPTVYTEPTFTLSGTGISYQATVTFAAGTVKNDSEGHPYPTGMIQAGTVMSNTISVAGRRYGFFGADAVALVPTSSSEIRDLTGKLPAIENGAQFTLNAPAGARRITFWYPNTCRDVQSVKYVEQGNAEYKDMFMKTTADVEGANGHAAAPYKGFTWLLAVASPSAMTFTVHV